MSSPLRDELPLKATALLNALQSKQIGGVRIKVDEEFMDRESIGPFDTGRWVKTLRPLRDWSLSSQLDEDEARLKELVAKRFIDHDFAWRVLELREKYKSYEQLFAVK